MAAALHSARSMAPTVLTVDRSTFLRFHAKWLSSPGPPREMTNAVLADYKQGLETIKMLCEKP